jgi:hypothetical protein
MPSISKHALPCKSIALGHSIPLVRTSASGAFWLVLSIPFVSANDMGIRTLAHATKHYVNLLLDQLRKQR